ncbi:MAG: NAD(P)-dependent oxidoreductase [Leptolinea sp.]|nr:NAD(P)-dependent oxidoreductase [Leptolinea sp.]
MRSKVLLIGSAGFIGQHLVQELTDVYELWEIDIPSFLNSTGKPGIGIDLLSGEASRLVRDNLRGNQFKAVIYLTNITTKTVPTGMDVEDANLLAVTNLLKGLDVHSEKFGLFSSVYVYKNPDTLQAITENSPIFPTSPYGRLKWGMENLTTTWGKEKGIPVNIFRPEWAYGPGDKTRKLIPELCRAAASTDVYSVKINPRETRQPIFVSDLVRGIKKWISLDQVHENEVFLMVGPTPITQQNMLQIARDNARLSQNPVVEFLDPDASFLNYSFDNIRTQKRLDWKAEISCTKGMQTLINYLDHPG